MKYKVIQVESSLNQFNEKVNEELKDGWKLQGGVSIAVTDNKKVFAQAMIKED